MYFLSIAGLQLNIDFADELISESLKDFETEPESRQASHFNYRPILVSLAGSKEAANQCAEPLSAEAFVSFPESGLATTNLPPQADYMHVRTTGFGYCFTYSAESTLARCDVDVTARKAVITQKNGCLTNSICNLARIKEDIFFAIRDVFFLFALREGRVPVHSSSVIYNDKAYLFSAPSGTGKTTHTNFWVEKYGVEILNGDVAMLALEDGEMMAYGLPWCGTSGKYTNKRVPLGGVIFLYRSETNRIRQMSSLEGITSLLARTLSTSFERTDVEQNLNTISNFAPYINFLRLDCTNSPEAAEVVKQYIDK